jgi:hypothetical protein
LGSLSSEIQLFRPVSSTSEASTRRLSGLFRQFLKNPLGKEELEYLPPEELVDNILAKETRIVEIMAEIKGSLGVER